MKKEARLLVWDFRCWDRFDETVAEKFLLSLAITEAWKDSRLSRECQQSYYQKLWKLKFFQDFNIIFIASETL